MLNDEDPKAGRAGGGKRRLPPLNTRLVLGLAFVFLGFLEPALLGGGNGLLLFALGAYLFYRGRSQAARDALEDPFSDDLPDVLYLRSFKDDKGLWGRTSLLDWLFGTVLAKLFQTEEELLADAVAPFGDLVALGEPGESLPRPGAARTYATHDEWQQLVEGLIDAARLVIVRAGRTPSVLWELGRCRQLLPPERLVVYVDMSRRRYRTFRQQAETSGLDLPDLDALPRGKVFALFRFDEQWRGEPMPLALPFRRRPVWRREFDQFKYALRPVFERFEVPWDPPARAWWPWLMVPWMIFVIFVNWAILSEIDWSGLTAAQLEAPANE